jgi:hypothetical protein
MRNKDQKKDPLGLPKRRLEARKERWGLKKKEKSIEILRNSKLPNLILHVKFGTKVIDDK